MGRRFGGRRGQRLGGRRGRRFGGWRGRRHGGWCGRQFGGRCGRRFGERCGRWFGGRCEPAEAHGRRRSRLGPALLHPTPTYLTRLLYFHQLAPARVGQDAAIDDALDVAPRRRLFVNQHGKGRRARHVERHLAPHDRQEAGVRRHLHSSTTGPRHDVPSRHGRQVRRSGRGRSAVPHRDAVLGRAAHHGAVLGRAARHGGLQEKRGPPVGPAAAQAAGTCGGGAAGRRRPV